MKEGTKNLKGSIINKIYCLNLAEVLARDIFMSKLVTGLFPCPGISRSSYLCCLIFSNFSFLSVAKIFRGSSPIISDNITLEGVQSFFSFPVNTVSLPK